jgi:MFS family permease
MVARPLAGAARAEWHAHWTLVLASSLGYAMVAIPTMTLGAFMAPLEAAFGWTRAELTAGLIVQSLVSIVGQPLVGRMIDRFGPRRIALIGLALSGCAFSAFSLMDGSVALWLGLWFLVATVTQLIYPPVWAAAVTSEFDAGRGPALAITLSGGAIVTLTGPVLATLLIEHVGWRSTYPILGLGPSFVLFLLCYFLFTSRLDRRRRPTEAVAVAPLVGASAREGLRSPTFYKLLFATLVGNPMVAGIMIHLIPILSGSGLSREQAAIVAGVLGPSAVVARLLCGALVARVPGHWLAAVMMALPIGGAVMLMSPSDSMLLRLIAVSFVGMSSGAQMKMNIYLASRHFGLRAFGTFLGFISMTFTVATGFGPFIAGSLFDLAGDYHLMLMLTIPLAVIGGLILLWIGDYPEDQPEATAAAQPSAS